MLETMLLGNEIKSYVIALIIVAFFVGFGHLFSILVIKTIKKLAAKTKNSIDDIIVQTIEKPLVFAIFLFGIYLAHFYISLSERGLQVYTNIMEILIVIEIIWVLIKLVDASIEHYFKPLIAKSESKLDDQILPFVRTFVKIIIIVIGAIFLIKSFGYDVTSLVAGLGIGGLAFALAAQPLLSNLFGGIAIIADKPFHIDDRIVIDGKYEGFVREIGMRSTIIETLNSTKLTIPNSVIATTVVENVTREKARKITMNLGLNYNTSTKKIEEAIKILKEILEKNQFVVNSDKDCVSIVAFNEFKEFSLNINVIYYIKDLDNMSKAKTEINIAIKEKFEKAGIEFAFPTQTVYVKKE